jgi:hypothetical protein
MPFLLTKSIPQMKKRSLLFALYLFSISTFAQSNFQPIQATKQDGTVLDGLGFYEVKNARAATNLVFRKNENLPIEYFSATELKMGKFENGRVIIPLSLPDTSIKEPVLVEQLITGRAFLYRYGNRFFISRFDRPVFELKQTFRQDPKNPSITLTEKQYVGVLKLYLGKDCPSLESKIANTQFTEESITKTIIQYHECLSDSAKVNKKKLSWLRIEPILASRIGFGKMSLLKNYTLNDGGDHLYTPLSFSGHLAFNFSFPRSNSKISLYAELWYLSQNFERTSNRQETYAMVNRESRFQLKELKMPLGLRYAKNGDPFNVFAQGGFVLKHNLSIATSYRYEQIGADFTRTSEEDYPSINPGITPGLWAGLGAKHYKLPLSAELRYTWDPQMLRYQVYSYASGQALNLIVAYHF